LRYYGCTPWPSIVKLEIAEFWQKPWETFPFTVPLEEGDRMSQRTLDDLKTMIWRTMPPGTKFPYDPLDPTGEKEA
jgi:hypothetical protein